MIERIECISANSQLHSFRDREFLFQGQVNFGVTGAGESVSAQVAIGAFYWDREGGDRENAAQKLRTAKSTSWNVAAGALGRSQAVPSAL